MDRDRLTELLQDPSQVAKQDLAALRTMAERFPWFSGAHLLLAVGESETGDVLANDSRSLPAAFLPSRSVLFDLVHKEEPREPSTLRIVKDEEPLEESFPTSGIPAPKIAEPTDATRPLPASFRNERRSPDVTHVPFEQDANPLKDEGSVVKKLLRPRNWIPNARSWTADRGGRACQRLRPGPTGRTGPTLRHRLFESECTITGNHKSTLNLHHQPI